MSKAITRRLGAACVLAAAWPLAASAGGSAEYTAGFGPESYRSDEVRGDIDLGEAWNLAVDHLRARTPGDKATTQTGLAANWQITKPVSATWRYTDAANGLMDITGHDIGVSLGLHHWAGAAREFSLDLGIARFTQEGTADAGVFAGRQMEQTRHRLGVYWELSDALAVHAAVESEHYDKDPVDVARRVLRRRFNSANAAFTLLGFADHAWTLGMDWSITDALTWRVVTGRTETVLAQQQKFVQLGADWRWSDALRIGASVTRNSSTTVRTPAGAVAMEGSDGTYSDVSVRWSF